MNTTTIADARPARGNVVALPSGAAHLSYLRRHAFEARIAEAPDALSRVELLSTETLRAARALREVLRALYNESAFAEVQRG